MSDSSNIQNVTAVRIHRSAHFHQWEYLEVLKRYGGLILLFTLSATLGALALTYIYSEKYQAVGEVLYRSAEVARLTNKSLEQTALGSPPPTAPFKVIKDTIDDYVHSESLLRGVVQKLHLDVPDSRDYSALPWYQRYYNETKDWLNDFVEDAWRFLKFGRYIAPDRVQDAAEKLSKDIDVDSEDSYLFAIKVKYKGPKMAAAIADAIMAQLDDTFSKHSREAARVLVTRLQGQFDEKRNKLLAYRAEILELLQTNHLSNIATEINADISRRSTYDGQLSNYQNDIANARGVIADLDRVLASKSQSAQTGATYSNISADDYKKAQSQRLFDDVDLQGKLAAASTLEKTIADLKARLLVLPTFQVKYDELSTELQVAANDYAKLSDSLTEARIQEAGLASEIQILGPAATPTDVATPIKIYHTGMALLLGLLVAVGLVYMLNYFNIRAFLPTQGVGGRRPPSNPPPVGGSDMRRRAAAE